MPEEKYRALRQSLLFTLFAACEKVFPGKAPEVHQSVNRSTYCELPGHIPTEEDLGALTDCMRQFIREKLPLTPMTYPKEEAMRLLRESGDGDCAEI